MEFFKEIFGGNDKKDNDTEKQPRANLGGDFMAVPDQNNDTTDEEAVAAEKTRLEVEALGAKIIEIESSPDHPEKGELDRLREEYRKLLQ